MKETADKETPEFIKEFGSDIKSGNMPLELIVNHFCKIILDLHNKIDNLNQTISHLQDISTKIKQIHSLHFPQQELEKQKNLKKRYLAEIIMGNTKKRKINGL